MDEADMADILGIPGDVREWLVDELSSDAIQEQKDKLRIWYEREFARLQVPESSKSVYSGFNVLSVRRLHLLVRFFDALSNPTAGDKVWNFVSAPATWAGLGGRRGLCIIQGGEVRAILVTGMS